MTLSDMMQDPKFPLAFALTSEIVHRLGESGADATVASMLVSATLAKMAKIIDVHSLSAEEQMHITKMSRMYMEECIVNLDKLMLDMQAYIDTRPTSPAPSNN